MELTSDIRSELVDEPSSHVSKVGTVDIQWRVPRLAAMALAPGGISSASPRSSETSLGMSCTDLKHLTGMFPRHTDSEHTSGVHQKMEKPDGSPTTMFSHGT